MEKILGQKRWLSAILVVCSTTILATTAHFLAISPPKSTSIAASSQQPDRSLKYVSGLGRLEPQGEVIKLSPPAYQGGAKVIRLLVKGGDWVEANQVVAILDNYEVQKAAVARSQAAVQVAETNLKVIEAGPKIGEVNAQKATIRRLQAELATKSLSQQAKLANLQAQLIREKQAREATLSLLQAELDNAQAEFYRYQHLWSNGATSKSEFDQRSLTLKTAQQRLKESQVTTQKDIEVLEKNIKEEEANFLEIKETLDQSIQEAQATLEQLQEVRPVDVAKGMAELAEAKASLQQAQADLSLTYVRTNQAGQVLKIHSHPGEFVNVERGIMEIGQTKTMAVIAEIYESDISKIKKQQQAVITSENDAFTGEVKGIVNSIGLKIGKKDILGTDPAADTDARVVEVEILLNPEDSQRVSLLTYSRVLVKILI